MTPTPREPEHQEPCRGRRPAGELGPGDSPDSDSLGDGESWPEEEAKAVADEALKALF